MPSEMNACDKHTIDNTGIPSLVLMERAAHSVCSSIIEEMGVVPKKALIICGCGNNAGDGLVVARELTDLGCCCDVLMSMGFSNLTPDTTREFNILKKSGCHITSDMKKISENIEGYEIVIDAIFGTGLNRKIPGYIDRFLSVINQINCFKCAVDVPTGIDSSTGGLFAKNPFKADMTVTFAFPKTGLFYYPAREYVGRLKCTYIGIHSKTPENINWRKKFLLDRKMISDYLPARKKDGHKGSFGKLCVIGGSEKYKGAPILSMRAALRSGIGLITGLLPKYKNITGAVPDPEMIVECGDCEFNFHDFSTVSNLLKKAEKNDATVLGPGIGREDSTQSFVKSFISRYQKPLLLDADALYAISNNDGLTLIKARKNKTVLTPHMAEFSRLTSLSIEEIKKDRFDILRNFSSLYSCTVVLKDSTTTIASDNGELYINTTGNNGLSTGGSGDVLSGIIGTFLAQGLSGVVASNLAVYLHGLTADIYSESNYSGGFIPSDICELIPKAIRRSIQFML